jgi:polyisoprenoid-binding protein YceI
MKRVLLALLLTTVGIAHSNAQTAAPAQPPARPQLGPNQWAVDSSHSAANFSVRHMMVTTVRGQLGPITGTVEYDGKDVTSARADVRIDVNGLTTQNAKRDGHLRSDDFFDAANHPAITFKSKRVEAGSAGAFKLIGDLTIRGVTKEVTLDIEGPSQPIQAQGATKIGATATTTINRQDYGVKWSRNLDGGGVVVGDEVKITLELELNKRAPAPPTQ